MFFRFHICERIRGNFRDSDFSACQERVLSIKQSRTLAERKGINGIFFPNSSVHTDVRRLFCLLCLLCFIPSARCIFFGANKQSSSRRNTELDDAKFLLNQVLLELCIHGARRAHGRTAGRAGRRGEQLADAKSRESVFSPRNWQFSASMTINKGKYDSNYGPGDVLYA